MCQAVLSPNLTRKFQWEVSQIAHNRFSCVTLLGSLSVNLNHLKTDSQEQIVDSSTQKGKQIRNQTVKSPSDTIIYSPGLRKLNSDEVTLIEKISNFVESIRLDGSRSSRIRSNNVHRDDMVARTPLISPVRDRRHVETASTSRQSPKRTNNMRPVVDGF